MTGYPATRRDPTTDNYHGTVVADPWRWLEKQGDPEVTAWAEAQNALTRSFLDDGPLVGRIRERLKAVMNYPRTGLPWKRGGRYFFSKNDGLQNHHVFYVQESLTGEPKVVIDPNKFSPDGTTSLGTLSMTKDSKLMAYGVSVHGSDQQEIRIRPVDSGEHLPETMKWCKWSSIAWRKDKSAFFYNRFPKPGTVPKEDENRHCKVYLHRLGTPQEGDALVYERADDPDLLMSPFMTEDQEYLVMTLGRGTDPRNMVYYRKAGSEGEFFRLLDDFDAKYWMIDNIGTVFYFHTDLDAPRGRVIAIDTEKPAREDWMEVIPESANMLNGVSHVGGKLVAEYMEDVCSMLTVFDAAGKRLYDIGLPGPGSVGGVSGRAEDKEMFYSFQSHCHPSTQFRHDLESGKSELFRKSLVDFEPDGYETKQVFFPSRDGTRIPMFITQKKGAAWDGSNPVELYGYGGFNISITPGFSTTNIPWLEAGGVLAVANLRGGEEYGEEWHKAGMLEKKQNVFDDFIAAAEWLVANKVTSPRRLAITGYSNGGLLTAACLTQRPDLFGAVHCGVPVADMLRYHKFTVGAYWVPEYGNAEEKEGDFRFLHAYSPVHRAREGVKYPPVLVTSADTDDRVVPMHGLKLTAALQAADRGGGPILLRFESKAGHGGGKPLWKGIEETADIRAFFFKSLGMA